MQIQSELILNENLLATRQFHRTQSLHYIYFLLDQFACCSTVSSKNLAVPTAMQLKAASFGFGDTLQSIGYISNHFAIWRSSTKTPGGKSGRDLRAKRRGSHYFRGRLVITDKED